MGGFVKIDFMVSAGSRREAYKGIFKCLKKRYKIGMEDRNQKVLSFFPLEDSWERKYSKIITLGRELPPFSEEDKVPKWLVKGCQSRLWLKPEQNEQGFLMFTGDSDGLISKGILALLIAFYSHQKPVDILESELKFMETLQLSQHLTPGRTNGLHALARQMLAYAKAFQLIQT